MARRGAGAAALGADGRQLASAQQTQGLTEAEGQAVPLAAWGGGTGGGTLRREPPPAPPQHLHPAGGHPPSPQGLRSPAIAGLVPPPRPGLWGTGPATLSFLEDPHF